MAALTARFQDGGTQLLVTLPKIKLKTPRVGHLWMVKLLLKSHNLNQLFYGVRLYFGVKVYFARFPLSLTDSHIPPTLSSLSLL